MSHKSYPMGCLAPYACVKVVSGNCRWWADYEDILDIFVVLMASEPEVLKLHSVDLLTVIQNTEKMGDWRDGKGI